MEVFYGRNDLQKYEKDTIQFPSQGRYTDELHSMGTRLDRNCSKQHRDSGYTARG
jgi:hypothetical protein